MGLWRIVGDASRDQGGPTGTPVARAFLCPHHPQATSFQARPSQRAGPHCDFEPSAKSEHPSTSSQLSAPSVPGGRRVQVGSPVISISTAGGRGKTLWQPSDIMECQSGQTPMELGFHYLTTWSQVTKAPAARAGEEAQTSAGLELILSNLQPASAIRSLAAASHYPGQMGARTGSRRLQQQPRKIFHDGIFADGPAKRAGVLLATHNLLRI